MKNFKWIALISIALGSIAQAQPSDTLICKNVHYGLVFKADYSGKKILNFSYNGAYRNYLATKADYAIEGVTFHLVTKNDVKKVTVEAFANSFTDEKGRVWYDNRGKLRGKITTQVYANKPRTFSASCYIL